LRPFPIYPLYTQTVILSLDKPIADCFLFRPRKSRKSAGNAVIPTFPTHWSHGLQHLRHKRRNARFKRLRRVHTHLRQQDRTQRITGRNRGVSAKSAESLRDSDALMRVAVPRRRGPAGLRDPVAVSLTAPMGFTVLVSRFVGTQKIERLFFSWYKISIAPEADMKPRRLCLFLL